MKANGAKGLPAEELGELVARVLTIAKPRVRYTIAPDALQTFMLAHLPRRIVDRLIGGQLGLLPKG